MALPGSLLKALLVLSCSCLCSLGCDLPQTHGLLSRRALTLLGHMRRVPASSCQEDRSDFAFPQGVFGGHQLQKAQALSVVHVTTQKLFQLLCTEASSSASWNRTLLEELCAGLYRQLSDLEACLMQDLGDADTPLPKEDSVLRSYFQRISVYLQEKQHSPCAWEVVRAEITRPVYSLAALHRRLRN
uniref:Uncharacterized protein n=1 Tax=Suricata suricatta TaxID=37032 RepID=A0A673U2Q0_SURSU